MESSVKTLSAMSVLKELAWGIKKLKNLKFDDVVRYFYKPTDPSSLGIIRFLFGLLMALDVTEERGGADIDLRYGNPTTCHFPLFPIVQPLPYPYMTLVYAAMWLGAVGIMLGFKFRISVFLFGVPYWYLILIDKSFWNNHSYLFGVVTVLLMGSSAHHFFSVDSLLNPKIQNTHVPFWNYFILKYQFFMLYFLAGLKKSDMEWLEGYSMANLGQHWVFAPFKLILSTELIDYLIVHWFGFLLDLTIGFWMLLEFSRPVAMIFCSMFHLMNSRLFSIGMFPYVCLATMPLFCKEDWPKKIFFVTQSFWPNPKISDACIYEDNDFKGLNFNESKCKDKNEFENGIIQSNRTEETGNIDKDKSIEKPVNNIKKDAIFDGDVQDRNSCNDFIECEEKNDVGNGIAKGNCKEGIEYRDKDKNIKNTVNTLEKDKIFDEVQYRNDSIEKNENDNSETFVKKVRGDTKENACIFENKVNNDKITKEVCGNNLNSNKHISTEKIKKKVVQKKIMQKPNSMPRFRHKFTTFLLLSHCALQMFLPYSHFITKGFNNWTNGLYGYSWDMMVHSWNTVLVVVKVVDNETGKESFIDSQAWTLNDRWNKHGDMCLQYAECIKKNLLKEGNDKSLELFSSNISIYIDVWCSLNKRFQQRMFNPNYDLLKAAWSPFQPIEWLMPVLSEYNGFRKRMSQISKEVYSWSNDSEVMFVADFPGLYLENYIGDDIKNVSVTILEGEVIYEVEDPETEQSIGIKLKKGDFSTIVEGTYHKIHTISSTPSSYMFIFQKVPQNEVEDEIGASKKTVYSPFPLVEDIPKRRDNFLKMWKEIKNSLMHILFGIPLLENEISQ